MPATTARAATSTLPRPPARIEAGEPHVWRLKVPLEHGPIEFDDAVYGHMSFPADVMDDMIVVRTDGTPTYNFAVVCDDANMGITHVIRGDDHLSNTPAPDPHLRGPRLRRAHLRAPVHDLGLRTATSCPSATARASVEEFRRATASCPTPW